MKKRCDNCLYATEWNDEKMNCHHAGLDYNTVYPDWWCSLWEPRDRNLIRCETCEWWDRDNKFGVSDERAANGLRACLHVGTSSAYVILDDRPTMALTQSTRPEFRCSAWRLREEP